MFEATLNDSHARLHKLLLAGMGGLMLFGMAFVYSATMVNEPVGLVQQFHESTFTQFLGWLWGTQPNEFDTLEAASYDCRQKT